MTGGKLAQVNPQFIVLTCEVAASVHEICALNKSKKKVIARRSDQKSQGLDVLVAWVTRAGLEAEDQVFTRSSTKHAGGRVGKKRLSAAMVREAVKDIAMSAELPPGRFSPSTGDRKDRGNYADGSTVFDTIYDYSAVGLGPLACNVNLGMGSVVKQTVEHVGHCSPRR